VRGLTALALNRLRRDPLHVTIELTRRCNARCDYCNHWKEQKQAEEELAEFVAVVERYRPFSVTICGGEPFLRRDAFAILEAVKRAPGWRYLSVITNGWFLTDDEKLERLLATGVDQINVSLNFPDERQDLDRQLPSLFARIAWAVPKLAARGSNVQLNTVLMNENLDDAAAIADLAAGWGAKVTYTLYSELPADNCAHLIPVERIPQLRQVLAELSLRRNVVNTRWYFERLPSYVAGTPVTGCVAGKETLHISPGGLVRPCAELPPIAPFRDYVPREAPPVDCVACFQACRGEAQAPITLGRLVEVIRG
jgi:MoaA/NifB/PqqE/SkfB family radical SAM enzyme